MQPPAPPTPFHPVAITDGAWRIDVYDLGSVTAVVYGHALAHAVAMLASDGETLRTDVRDGLPQKQIFGLAGEWPNAAWALVLTENSAVFPPKLFRTKKGVWKEVKLGSTMRPSELFAWHDGALVFAEDYDVSAGLLGASFIAAGTSKQAPRFTAAKAKGSDTNCQVAMAPAQIVVTPASEVVVAGCVCNSSRDEQGPARCHVGLESWSAKSRSSSISSLPVSEDLSPRALWAPSRREARVLLAKSQPDGSSSTLVVARLDGGVWTTGVSLVSSGLQFVAVTESGEFWVLTRKELFRHADGKWSRITLPSLERVGAPASAEPRLESLAATGDDVWLAVSFEKAPHQHRTVLFRTRPIPVEIHELPEADLGEI